MEAAQAEKTLAQIFSWTERFLGYTDMVCQSVPDDQDAIRPTDPKGGWVFSALEQAAHIADTRWMFVEWITGEDLKGRQIMQEYGGTDKPWEFKPLNREDVLSSLKEARGRIDEIFTWPGSRVLETTDAQRMTYENLLKAVKEKGDDPSELEAAGPSNIANTIMFLHAHEQSHRSVLQHMLRMSGADVARMA